MPTPTLGLRGEFNPELRKRDVWARLATTLAALGTIKEGRILSSIQSSIGADRVF